MLKEFLIVDKSPQLGPLERDIKYALEQKIDSICMPTGLIKYIKNIDSKFISAQIDYPYGLSDTKTKIKDINYCLGLGINNIDIVVNHFFIENLMWKDSKNELENFLGICKKSNKTFRPIIDYRLIEGFRIKNYASILKTLGIDTVIVGTGTLLDDPVDNILCANYLYENFSIKSICSRVARTSVDIDYAKMHFIHGLRVSSIKSLDLILEK